MQRAEDDSLWLGGAVSGLLSATYTKLKKKIKRRRRKKVCTCCHCKQSRKRPKAPRRSSGNVVALKRR